MNVQTCPPQPVRFHEYANLFPMIQGEALDALREDIRRNGVREPIVMLGDAILDGRNRYMCARDLGMEYPVREFPGGDVLGFVVSANLARRHLSESQRASIAARVANLGHGGDRSEQAANLPLEPFAPSSVTQAEAARMLSVSERSVREAKRVHETAPPEVVQAVDDGRISVSLASQVTSLPEAAQAEVVAAPPEETRTVARDAVKRAHVANNSGNSEWYTPAEYVEVARSVLGGFDLDPASSEVANRTVKAERFFTAEDDGLAQEWPIGRIWMNPPYAKGLMDAFAERFVTEAERGSTGIVLVNNATETAWFQGLARACAALCLPRGRIRYLDATATPANAPLQGQAFVYFGPNVASFAEAFAISVRCCALRDLRWNCDLKGHSRPCRALTRGRAGARRRRYSPETALPLAFPRAPGCGRATRAPRYLRC